jgi:hypothetical protein
MPADKNKWGLSSSLSAKFEPCALCQRERTRLLKREKLSPFPPYSTPHFSFINLQNAQGTANWRGESPALPLSQFPATSRTQEDEQREVCNTRSARQRNNYCRRERKRICAKINQVY